jgi:hypothetical protein
MRGASGAAFGRFARLDAGVDLRPDIGQALAGGGAPLIKAPEAAGTCLTIAAWGRETNNAQGFDHSGKRYAGARASQAKIGLMRRQQRHKSYPEYGPENHQSAFSRWYARSMRHALFRCLKPFAKFETNWLGIAGSSH